jgi:acyl-CoA thioesterase FadM
VSSTCLSRLRVRYASHSGARVAFEYEVRLEADEAPLATGFTAHAAVDGRGKPRRLPPGLRRLLQ